MFQPVRVFSGLSVDDLGKAKEFYTKVMGLALADEAMGLSFDLTGGGRLFIYNKPNHEPATYTVLNFAVSDIDAAVDELAERGVSFEHYDGPMKPDAKGIMRSPSAEMGPDIAWFKDPAGNILAVLQDDKA